MDTKLPDTLSGLLRVALDDLEKVEQMPDYTINMSVWHRPYNTLRGRGCSVCLAGSMLVTRGASKEDNITPHSLGLSRVDTEKLFGVNRLRMGDVCAAYRCLERAGVSQNRLTLGQRLDLSREIPSYHIDKQEFKSKLRTLADDLEKAGV